MVPSAPALSWRPSDLAALSAASAARSAALTAQLILQAQGQHDGFATPMPDAFGHDAALLTPYSMVPRPLAIVLWARWRRFVMQRDRVARAARFAAAWAAKRSRMLLFSRWWERVVVRGLLEEEATRRGMVRLATSCVRWWSAWALDSRKHRTLQERARRRARATSRAYELRHGLRQWRAGLDALAVVRWCERAGAVRLRRYQLNEGWGRLLQHSARSHLETKRQASASHRFLEYAGCAALNALWQHARACRALARAVHLAAVRWLDFELRRTWRILVEITTAGLRLAAASERARDLEVLWRSQKEVLSLALSLAALRRNASDSRRNIQTRQRRHGFLRWRASVRSTSRTLACMSDAQRQRYSYLVVLLTPRGLRCAVLAAGLRRWGRAARRRRHRQFLVALEYVHALPSYAPSLPQNEARRRREAIGAAAGTAAAVVGAAVGGFEANGSSLHARGLELQAGLTYVASAVHCLGRHALRRWRRGAAHRAWWTEISERRALPFFMVRRLRALHRACVTRALDSVVLLRGWFARGMLCARRWHLHSRARARTRAVATQVLSRMKHRHYGRAWQSWRAWVSACEWRRLEHGAVRSLRCHRAMWRWRSRLLSRASRAARMQALENAVLAAAAPREHSLGKEQSPAEEESPGKAASPAALLAPRGLPALAPVEPPSSSESPRPRSIGLARYLAERGITVMIENDSGGALPPAMSSPPLVARSPPPLFGRSRSGLATALLADATPAATPASPPASPSALGQSARSAFSPLDANPCRAVPSPTSACDRPWEAGRRYQPSSGSSVAHLWRTPSQPSPLEQGVRQSPLEQTPMTTPTRLMRGQPCPRQVHVPSVDARYDARCACPRQAVGARYAYVERPEYWPHASPLVIGRQVRAGARPELLEPATPAPPLAANTDEEAEEQHAASSMPSSSERAAAATVSSPPYDEPAWLTHAAAVCSASNTPTDAASSPPEPVPPPPPPPPSRQPSRPSPPPPPHTQFLEAQAICGNRPRLPKGCASMPVVGSTPPISSPPALASSSWASPAKSAVSSAKGQGLGDNGRGPNVIGANAYGHGVHGRCAHGQGPFGHGVSPLTRARGAKDTLGIVGLERATLPSLHSGGLSSPIEEMHAASIEQQMPHAMHAASSEQQMPHAQLVAALRSWRQAVARDQSLSLSLGRENRYIGTHASLDGYIGTHASFENRYIGTRLALRRWMLATRTASWWLLIEETATNSLAYHARARLFKEWRWHRTARRQWSARGESLDASIGFIQRGMRRRLARRALRHWAFQIPVLRVAPLAQPVLQQQPTTSTSSTRVAPLAQPVLQQQPTTSTSSTRVAPLAQPVLQQQAGTAPRLCALSISQHAPRRDATGATVVNPIRRFLYRWARLASKGRQVVVWLTSQRRAVLSMALRRWCWRYFGGLAPLTDFWTQSSSASSTGRSSWRDELLFGGASKVGSGPLGGGGAAPGAVRRQDDNDSEDDSSDDKDEFVEGPPRDFAGVWAEMSHGLSAEAMDDVRRLLMRVRMSARSAATPRRHKSISD
jgi:hypothetical protein